eukprot:6263723-Ditylum_brightwellii.AAC.1
MGIPGVANVSAVDDASVTSEITEASDRGEEVTDNEEKDNNSVVSGIKTPKKLNLRKNKPHEAATGSSKQQTDEEKSVSSAVTGIEVIQDDGQSVGSNISGVEPDQLPNHSEDNTSMTSAVTGVGAEVPPDPHKEDASATSVFTGTRLESDQITTDEEGMSTSSAITGINLAEAGPNN